MGSQLGSEEKTQALLVPCGNGQMDTIMVSKHIVWYGREKERETERVMSYGQRHIWRGRSNEEQAEVGDLTATQGLGDVWVMCSSWP